MPLFTKDNAAILGRKGAIARWTPKPEPAIIPLPDPVMAETVAVDQLGEKLRCACEETLDKLRKTADAQAKAQLARCVRDLRETYHLVTGKAKPGVTKPSTDRGRRTTSGGPTPIDSVPGTGQ